MGYYTGACRGRDSGIVHVAGPHAQLDQTSLAVYRLCFGGQGSTRALDAVTHKRETFLEVAVGKYRTWFDIKSLAEEKI